METNKELQTKLSRIYNLLDRHQVEGLLLRWVSNFAWASCGAFSFVNTAAPEGAASLLITREHRYLLTNNIEAPRLQQECGLAPGRAGRLQTARISGFTLLPGNRCRRLSLCLESIHHRSKGGRYQPGQGGGQ